MAGGARRTSWCPPPQGGWLREHVSGAEGGVLAAEGHLTIARLTGAAQSAALSTS